MKYIDFNSIAALHINTEQCLDWIREALQHKDNAVLPEKISIKFDDDCFFNTMPCYLPKINRFGIKVVSRYPAHHKTSGQNDHAPAILADILLYDSNTGELLAIMDGTWITIMRTGAMTALSIDLLKKKETASYSFIGLGNTACASLVCLCTVLKNKPVSVKLCSYKNQHTVFIKRFSDFNNIHFKVYDSAAALIRDSEVVISCVTVAKTDFAHDADYNEGVLVVPVHTRGFQNCDLFFDKVFCDDKAHINNFKYFNYFKYCAEIAALLLDKNQGRESEKERILVYNIGIALHDIFFASKIYDLLNTNSGSIVLSSSKPSARFWL
ncbi:MAG: ornithine cyclodeaminase [Bacteroidales bacterium]|jgi:ornithine cyclodeaminase/alanine dehydrogenase-like protein (mu-crystallin family)|nr:ornithine cyclodeaminase [Bacteroidales bacterium]